MSRLVTSMYLVSLGLGLATTAGCDPTPEKIAHWKETERGPRKLRDALAQSSLAPSLRAQALAALVEVGMTQEALTDLGALPATERQAVIHEAVPRLAEVAKGQGVAGAATTRPQREAKDALFALRTDAAPADRDADDQALIDWTTADLAGRMAAGGKSSEVILTAIGPKAAPRLGELLVPGTSQLVPAAAIFGHIADADTRARAGEQLATKVRAMGPRVDDDSLRALAAIGGPRATAFLLETAEHGTVESRQKALLALGQAGIAVDPSARAAALRIAGDKKAPGEVREAAFQLLEKQPEAVPGLVTLMKDPDATVRWRAVEAALAAGKDKAVAPVLEGLDPASKYKTEDLDSYVVHDLTLIGPAAMAPLQSETSSKNVNAQTVAKRALAQLQKR